MHRTVLLLSLFVMQPAIADTFHLRSGGQLEGELINGEEKPRRSYQIRLRTGGEVTLDVRDVSRVGRLSATEQQYHELLQRMPDNVESHWRMAELCQNRALPRERKFHLEQILRLDPNHEAARRALKYKKQADGTWATVEELQIAAGLEKVGGKWMTKSQADRKRREEQQRDARTAWLKKLKVLREGLNSRRRRESSLAAINAIDDPMATEALIKMFHSDRSYQVRELIAEVLGRLGNSAATATLARASMMGGSEDARELGIYCLRQLEKNKRRSAVPYFLSELRSNKNSNVRRAGYALERLGNESSVLPLIKAVRTKHTRLVGGQGNGGINVGQGGLSVGKTPPKKVDEYRENKEVLNALVSITKQDYGYDQRRWLDWYQQKTSPPKRDLRRDP